MSVTAPRASGPPGSPPGSRRPARPTSPWSSTTARATPPPPCSPATGSRPRRCCGRSRCSPTAGSRAVVLNSGGANACTGPDGFADTHRTAEHVAAALRHRRRRGRGLLDRPDRRAAADGRAARRRRRAAAALADDGGADAAEAIRTTDTVAKHGGRTTATAGRSAGWPRAPACSRPAWPRCCACSPPTPSSTRPRSTRRCATPPGCTFDRIDSDGCMSTNDTVLLLASGASGVTPEPGRVRRRSCARSAPTCAAQLIADAEGATKEVADRGRRRGHRGRRGRGRPRDRPQQPAQVRAVRQRPELGPGAGRGRHDRGRLRARRLDVAINGVRVCRGGAPARTATEST